MLLVYPLEDGIEHIGMAGEVNALRFLLCYLFIVLLFLLKKDVHLQLEGIVLVCDITKSGDDVEQVQT